VLWQREWKGEMVKEEMVIEKEKQKGKKKNGRGTLFWKTCGV
jgi:hypothetical protein